jgi:hypothetical protein
MAFNKCLVRGKSRVSRRGGRGIRRRNVLYRSRAFRHRRMHRGSALRGSPAFRGPLMGASLIGGSLIRGKSHRRGFIRSFRRRAAHFADGIGKNVVGRWKVAAQIGAPALGRRRLRLSYRSGDRPCILRRRRPRLTRRCGRGAFVETLRRRRPRNLMRERHGKQAWRPAPCAEKKAIECAAHCHTRSR